MKQYTTNCRCRNEKTSDGATVDYLLEDERVSDIIKDLCGTGTTAKLIAKETGLTVQGYLSGPLGGDLEIGAKVAEREIDVVIFFWDPLQAQPHDPDVKALLRIAALYDVPIATNNSTANYILHSDLIG